MKENLSNDFIEIECSIVSNSTRIPNNLKSTKMIIDNNHFGAFVLFHIKEEGLCIYTNSFHTIIRLLWKTKIWMLIVTMMMINFAFYP